MQFENVTAIAKGNVYYDGKVVSHAIIMPDGSRKTLGVILPGSYHFGTAAAERMDIVAGSCAVKLDGSNETQDIPAGSYFDVPANSGFAIEVSSECHYVCSYL